MSETRKITAIFVADMAGYAPRRRDASAFVDCGTMRMGAL